MFRGVEKSTSPFDAVHLQWFSDPAPAPAPAPAAPVPPPVSPVNPPAPEPALPVPGAAPQPALPGWVAQLTKAQQESVKAEVTKNPEYLKGMESFTLGQAWDRILGLQAKASTAIQVPNKDAPKEQWDEYRKALHVPESPDKYAFTKPNLPKGMLYNENFERWFKEQAFAGNVSQEAAAAMLSGYNEQQIAAFSAMVAKKNADFAKLNQTFQSKYGQEAPAKVKQMIDGFRTFATPGFVEKMKQFDLENDPDCVETFVKIGAAMADDTFRGGSRGRADQGPPQLNYDWMEKDFPKQDS
jgi:hypothetical protein